VPPVAVDWLVVAPEPLAVESALAPPPLPPAPLALEYKRSPGC